uniref:Uncharacterized protein n=1 Tax=Knipowitschia caucasica TaxID=637954 RepID=A0AAV2JK52_KNICA
MTPSNTSQLVIPLTADGSRLGPDIRRPVMFEVVEGQPRLCVRKDEDYSAGCVQRMAVLPQGAAAGVVPTWTSAGRFSGLQSLDLILSKGIKHNVSCGFKYSR